MWPGVASTVLSIALSSASLVISRWTTAAHLKRSKVRRSWRQVNSGEAAAAVSVTGSDCAPSKEDEIPTSSATKSPTGCQSGLADGPPIQYSLGPQANTRQAWRGAGVSDESGQFATGQVHRDRKR